MKIFQEIFSKKNNIHTDKNEVLIDPYDEIGKLIKESRLENNLSIEELSNISKIPLSTIRSIENNIKETRPGYPFIRSILFKLEDCLYLQKNQLTRLMQPEIKVAKKNINKNYIIRKLNLFDSWNGNIFYLLILIISIFVLNNYYLRNRIIEFKFIENNINNSEEISD